MKLLAQQKGRAGQYIRQVSGYSAFLPTPLPPEPPLQMDDETLALISQADRALGRLDGSIQTLPAPDLFVFMYIRKEAVFSSQIEGTQSSLDDVLEAEARVFNPQRPGDVNEVLNYVKALRFGLERLSELPVSVRLIREIHERLLEGARRMERKPGELRTTQNWIGPAGSTLNEATFIPPPPDAVPQLLGQLESFLHQTDPMPSLIKIGLAHAQFETIHPFLDGNGRMGRLLITFLLCERKILHQPVLYLSHHLKRYRNQYYDLLQNIRDDGNWEDWIKFFLSAVTEVSQEATQTARRIVSLREEHRRIITENFGRTAANGIKVLEQLFSHPIISVNDLAKQTNISFTAANQLMRRFIEHHILTEMTGHTRNRQFRYRPYIDLFADR
ncbi:MAG: Fic family protein [Nitrospirota bacterium]|nr:Fic family protein [Nitrospirota bacterium]MDH5585455.1 Fic family protein [Nitrospirota bacterium]